MSKKIIFRLTEGRTPASWTLSGGYAVKPGKGSKLINYYPGSDSYFVEDQTSDIKPQEVEFLYNDILSDPATEIQVDENNKCLVGYLTSHAFYNVHYKIHNEDEINEEKSKNYDKIEEALSLIKETNDLKVLATALAVFGIEAYGWIPSKAKASLKEKAITQPEFIIEKFSSSNYESKYLSALAFFSEIITEDSLKSAVVWNDGEKGIILRLAKGENGITKLAEMIAESTDESNLILQEIGIRLKKNKTADIEVAGAKELNVSLEDAQTKYKAIFGKEVPNNKKNNLDWLNAEIEKGI